MASSPRATRYLCLLLLATTVAFGNEGEREYERGRKAENGGDYLQAYTHYIRARGYEPANVGYIRAATRVSGVAAQTVAAGGDGAMAREIDPDGLFFRPNDQSKPALPEPPEESIELKPPVRLDYERKKVDLRFKSTAQEAYESLAEQFGVHVLLDQDFDGEREIRLELQDQDFPHAIVALNEVSKGFFIPLSEKLFMVAEDTPNKRNELEPVTFATVRIPDTMTLEEANEVGQAVQQALDIKRLQIVPSQQSVVLRDTDRKVRMARELYEKLSQPRAEVVIETDLIAVTRNGQTDYGVTLPTSFPVTNFSTAFNNQPPELDAASAVSLVTVGGGDSLFGVTIGGGSLEASMQRGDATTIQSFRLRAADGTEATLKIGERFPIINASFGAAVTNDQIQGEIDGGTFRQPIPSFTFEDLGLILTITPRIHSETEVTLQYQAEFLLLAGGAVNGVPILANRSFEGQIRIGEGEGALVAGMTVYESRGTRSGMAGLGRAPGLRKLFRSNSRQFIQRDLVLVMRPRVVRLPASEAPSVALRFGPEQRPLPSL